MNDQKKDTGCETLRDANGMESNNMPRKRRPLAEETRQALLRSAEAMYSVKGYAGTNFSALAKPLGVSGQAIYYHFKSKSQLLTEAYVSRLKEMTAHHRADQERQLPAPAQLWRFVCRHVLINLGSPASRGTPGHRIYAAVHLMREADAADRERLRRAAFEILELLRSILARGMQDETMPALTERTLTPTAFAILSIGNMSGWWFEEGRTLSAQELATQYADLALRTVGARPLRGKLREIDS